MSAGKLCTRSSRGRARSWERRRGPGLPSVCARSSRTRHSRPLETEAGRLVDGWASRAAQSTQLDPGIAACVATARARCVAGRTRMRRSCDPLRRAVNRELGLPGASPELRFRPRGQSNGPATETTENPE